MRYASIRKLDISNGEGIGASLFVQGCHFHCKNCFNKDTWDFDGGKEWTKDVKKKFMQLTESSYIKRISILGGEPLANENLKDVFELITDLRSKYPIKRKNDTLYSCRNNKDHNILTINPDEIRLSYPEKTIWLYTGYTWEQIMYPVVTGDFNPERDKLVKMRQDIVRQCDVLVDGRYEEDKRDVAYHWAGSTNQRVIDIRRTLEQGSVVLWENQ